jgi:hypothetical protein
MTDAAPAIIDNPDGFMHRAVAAGAKGRTHPARVHDMQWGHIARGASRPRSATSGLSAIGHRYGFTSRKRRPTLRPLRDGVTAALVFVVPARPRPTSPRPDETLTWTSAKAMEVSRVGCLAISSLVQHRSADVPSLAAQLRVMPRRISPTRTSDADAPCRPLD